MMEMETEGDSPTTETKESGDDDTCTKLQETTLTSDPQNKDLMPLTSSETENSLLPSLSTSSETDNCNSLPTPTSSQNGDGDLLPSTSSQNDNCEASTSSSPSTIIEPSSGSTVQDDQVPSTSANVFLSSDTGNNLSVEGNVLGPVENNEEAMSSDNESSSEDESNQFSGTAGSDDNNDPVEELILQKNANYLLGRCSSLIQRVQGIMLNSTKKHVSKQLQAVTEHPVLNPVNSRLHNHGRNSSSYQDSASSSLTKQSLSEIEFTVKLMKSLIRQNMGFHLNDDKDSGTDESDSDDDEVVLPDERVPEPEAALALGYAYPPYLPVENNPFIEAVKLEKMYEAKRTSLDFSINECEYSLTKSSALRKHCKARKPMFQLEKPSASSSIINIPVDPTSSVKFYHDSKPTTTRRVSDIMNERRSSLEKDTIKIGASGNDNSSQDGNASRSITVKQPSPSNSESTNEVNSENSSNADASQSSKTGTPSDENVIPSVKAIGASGLSVLGVEFVNSSNSNESSSRCSGIKRPDKNRKVFQLGGIQNIFRDVTSLPTVRCTCFGRSELCAVCLGRAKKKAEINHVFMNHKDKLAILDETFHKSLSIPEDVPLEVLLVTNSVGTLNPPLIQPTSSIQQLIKERSQHFPPDLLETGPRPKKPRIYGIKPYVEVPAISPKKDNRYIENMSHPPRKRSSTAQKSQSSFEENDYPAKGLGWPSRERKDSLKRSRNHEYDIDNIVIPYSMAAATRVEQLVYKPIETPRWRLLDYSEIFSTTPEGVLEDMSNAAFLDRHNKCEKEEKKKYAKMLEKALNATRKTRRLDSTGRSESMCESGDLHGQTEDIPSAISTPPPVHSPGKVTDKETTAVASAADDNKGSSTPVPDAATVITEAMANQALKSLFKVGRRRNNSNTTSVPTTTTSTPTATTSIKEVKMEPEEEEPACVDSKAVDPWPERSFPLSEADYKEMVDVMESCYPDLPEDVPLDSTITEDDDDPLSNPICV